MTFTKTKTTNDIISKHFHITPFTTYLEFMLPDGRYFYYEFEPNHILRDRIIFNLNMLEFEK